MGQGPVTGQRDAGPCGAGLLRGEPEARTKKLWRRASCKGRLCAGDAKVRACDSSTTFPAA
eukprot:351943-Chlamydomonas_euryale.AAC.13